MNDSLYVLPLVEPAVEPAVVDPLVALEDELDDEQPTVSASSVTAAAPAVGATKNRFILAPSRETWVGCRPRMTPGVNRVSVRCPACRRPADPHVQLLAISRKHDGLIFQQSCHRCQDSNQALFFQVQLGQLGSMYRFGVRS